MDLCELHSAMYASHVGVAHLQNFSFDLLLQILIMP